MANYHVKAVQNEGTFAFGRLRDNLFDVIRLAIFRDHLAKEERLPLADLEILNKSAIVMLCSYWEAFCEDLLAFALDQIAIRAEPDAVPAKLKVKIAEILRRKPDERQVWRLTGDGWRSVLREIAEDLRHPPAGKDLLNTPKSTQVDELFDSFLGISLSKAWSWRGVTCDVSRARLDSLVTLRGDIAHRGRTARTISKGEIRQAGLLILRLASRSELVVAARLATATGHSLSPSAKKEAMQMLEDESKRLFGRGNIVEKVAKKKK